MSQRWLSLALLAALGCAQGDPIPDGAVDTSYLVLTPTAETIAPVASDWAARWSAATGLAIRVGDGGVPVGFSDGALADPGNLAVDDCGQTEMTDGAPDWVLVDGSAQIGCAWAESVGHEIGHAIAGTPDHAASGVMLAAAQPGPQKIDAASLEIICETAPCTAFVPEGQSGSDSPRGFGRDHSIEGAVSRSTPPAFRHSL